MGCQATRGNARQWTVVDGGLAGTGVGAAGVAGVAGAVRRKDESMCSGQEETDGDAASSLRSGGGMGMMDGWWWWWYSIGTGTAGRRAGAAGGGARLGRIGWAWRALRGSRGARVSPGGAPFDWTTCYLGPVYSRYLGWIPMHVSDCAAHIGNGTTACRNLIPSGRPSALVQREPGASH